MIKLTAELKRSITEDWRSCFKSLGVYKPMWLGRLVGPFFQGVCLERSSGSTSYIPTSHLHCLCRDFPVVSLTLGQRLLLPRSGSEERILVQFHRDHFEDAARRLRAASLLPLERSWGLADLTSAVQTYQTLGRPDSRYPIFAFEDVVMAAVWLGECDRAKSAVAEYEKIVAGWPENITARFDGNITWARKLREIIDNPRTLRDLADANAEKLKVRNLPQTEMLS